MNRNTSRILPVLLGSLIAFGAQSAQATTYSSNGNTGFGGDLGLGSLNVTNDGTGGLNFVLSLNGTSNVVPNNAIVIYIDNGTGSVIGGDTSGMNDTSNGATRAISEYGGSGEQSILSFGGLMSPQYGVSLTNNNALDYKLVNNGSLSYVDNADVNGATSGNGESYTISGDTWSLDLPATDFGLNAFSGAVLKFLAIEVSQTGYSSNEATVSLSSPGGQGYNQTQTITSVNSFTAVPEASTAGLLACGAAVLLVLRGRMRRPGRA